VSDAASPLEDSSEERTIVDCATKALNALGKPSTVQEIYDFICANKDYQFNTPVPEHVLRTSIQRHTVGTTRKDKTRSLIFEETEHDTYQLVNTPPKRRSQPGMRRINRAADKEDIIKNLTGPTGVFREIWRLLLFAAVLGFKCGRREPLVNAGGGIDQQTFGNTPSWPGILHLMGLVETSSTKLFSSSEDTEIARIQMFEEYANGGLALLKERCVNTDAGFDFVVGFVTEHLNEETATKPDLKILI
jgi:dnd system-associated protein 4